MAHTAFDRHHKQRGYASLDTIRCDCGQPAKHQVQAMQFNASGRQLTVIIPLCENCFVLMLQEDKGVVKTW